MNATFNINEFVLNLDREKKLDLLEAALKEDKFGEFMQFSKILLDAPIHKGGLPTEDIELVRKKYF